MFRAAGTTGLAVGALYGGFRFLLCTCERIRGREDLFNAAAAGGMTGLLATARSGQPSKMLGTALIAAGSCSMLFALENRGGGKAAAKGGS